MLNLTSIERGVFGCYNRKRYYIRLPMMSCEPKRYILTEKSLKGVNREQKGVKRCILCRPMLKIGQI